MGLDRDAKFSLSAGMRNLKSRGRRILRLPTDPNIIFVSVKRLVCRVAQMPNGKPLNIVEAVPFTGHVFHAIERLRAIGIANRNSFTESYFLLSREDTESLDLYFAWSIPRFDRYRLPILEYCGNVSIGKRLQQFAGCSKRSDDRTSWRVNSGWLLQRWSGGSGRRHQEKRTQREKENRALRSVANLSKVSH